MKAPKPVYNPKIAGTDKSITDIIRAIKNSISRRRRNFNSTSSVRSTLANSSPYCHVAYEGNESLYKYLLHTGVKCPHCNSTNKSIFTDAHGDKHVVLGCDCISTGYRSNTAEMYILAQCSRCGKIFITTMSTPIEHSNHTYSLPTFRTARPLNPYYLMREFRGLEVNPTDRSTPTDEDLMFGSIDRKILCTISSKNTEQPISKSYYGETLDLADVFLNHFQSAVMSLSIYAYILAKYEEQLKEHENFVRTSRRYREILDEVVRLSSMFNTVQGTHDVINSKCEDFTVFDTLDTINRMLDGVKLDDDNDMAILNFALAKGTEKAGAILPVLSELEYTKMNKDNETSLYAIM